MRYLLDVNLLVAWGWADHADHGRAASWIARSRRKRGTVLFTSAIPQLGFVRVTVQRTSGRVSPTEAGQTLSGMLGTLGSVHRFLPDDEAAVAWPEWCRGAGQTTDAHLLRLAESHQAILATLDTGIPGALVIPDTVDAD
jgi:predicted nucleic acid-binding protein